MKKVLALVIALITLFTCSTALAADIAVKVNGEDVTFDRAPYVEDGKVMIPYRFVAEKLGALVAWDGETKTIFTSLDTLISTMQIGNSRIFCDVEILDAQTAPGLVIDRTYVSEEVLEFVLKADVSFDEATSTVTITK